MSYLIWLLVLTALYGWTAGAVKVIDHRAFVIATKCFEELKAKMEEK